MVTSQCTNIYKFSDPISVSRVQLENNFLFTASWDKMIRVVDLDKGMVQKSFVASKETIKEMLITDKKIIVAGVDPIIRAYDMISGAVQKFVGHKGWVYSLFVYKGLLYSGGDDKVVRVWDMETGNTVEELNAHRNGVTSICICNK